MIWGVKMLRFLSAVCDCGISWSYSFTFYHIYGMLLRPSLHCVTKICKPLMVHGVISLPDSTSYDKCFLWSDSFYLKVPKFISRKSHVDIDSLLLLILEQCSPFTTCLILEPQRNKTCLWEFASNKGTDQPAHQHSLISAFDISFFERTISKLATNEISIF